MTIKEAFTKLTAVTAAAMKNPFFVMRKLHDAFADISDKVIDSGGVTTSADLNTYDYTKDTTRLNGVRKCGNVVTVDLNLTNVVSTGSNIVLATIPEGYRPVTDMFIAREAGSVTLLDIKTNGNIVTTSEFTSRAIRMHTGWIVD